MMVFLVCRGFRRDGNRQKCTCFHSVLKLNEEKKEKKMPLLIEN